jgi:hypothetical protein
MQRGSLVLVFQFLKEKAAVSQSSLVSANPFPRSTAMIKILSIDNCFHVTKLWSTLVDRREFRIDGSAGFVR